MGILQKTISYPAGDINVPGILYLPENRSGSAVVVVLHGSDGFKPNHAEIAMRLANEGFAAVAVSWFGGESARSHWKELRADDVVSVFDLLQQLPSVDVDKLGMIGFSRGGGLALIMASMMPQVKAVVNYFGLTAWQGGLEEFDHLPLNRSEPLDFVRRLACPVLSFHGKIDTVVSVANTIELDTACKTYGVDHRHILYPDVNHSFIWPGDKYNHEAHQDSWKRTLAFFKTHLRYAAAAF